MTPLRYEITVTRHQITTIIAAAGTATIADIQQALPIGRTLLRHYIMQLIADGCLEVARLGARGRFPSSWRVVRPAPNPDDVTDPIDTIRIEHRAGTVPAELAAQCSLAGLVSQQMRAAQ